MMQIPGFATKSAAVGTQQPASKHPEADSLDDHIGGLTEPAGADAADERFVAERLGNLCTGDAKG